jgi:hypothetical protein
VQQAAFALQLLPITLVPGLVSKSRAKIDFKSCHTLHTDKAGQGINVHVQKLEQVQGISIKAFRVLKLLAAFFVASAAGLRVDGRKAGGANEGGEDGAGEHFAGSSWFV